MINDLYLKDNYLNKNINHIFNKVIIEYDLKSANTSLSKEYKLLDIKRIREIEDMKKKDRVVTIGKIQSKDKVFKNNLKKAFIDIRRRFFETNNIKSEDILSIKKDAIFCLKYVDNVKFGECEFVEKNVYTSYMYLNRLEFYYKTKPSFSDFNYILDIKGIDDSILKKHEDYLMKFFATLFKHFETSSVETQLSYLRRFIDKYKRLELEVGYYREFNQSSIIRLKDSDETYDDEIFIPYEHKTDYVNIDYNFFNILLPIVRMLI